VSHSEPVSKVSVGSAEETIPFGVVRRPLALFIQQQDPTFREGSSIPVSRLNEYRGAYVQSTLESELGEISDLEQQVISSLKEHQLISENPQDEDAEKRTFGERVADGMASFGGSWAFILSFFGFILLWIAANIWMWRNGAPDPYPFILLNLILSCLASLQAPVIMMSQNRQEVRDRERAMADYQINLKAELEIRHLHEKIDHLLQHHSQRLLEIQEIQVDLLRQLLGKQTGSEKSLD